MVSCLLCFSLFLCINTCVRLCWVGGGGGGIVGGFMQYIPVGRNKEGQQNGVVFQSNLPTALRSPHVQGLYSPMPMSRKPQSPLSCNLSRCPEARMFWASGSALYKSHGRSQACKCDSMQKGEMGEIGEKKTKPYRSSSSSLYLPLSNSRVSHNEISSLSSPRAGVSPSLLRPCLPLSKSLCPNHSL